MDWQHILLCFVAVLWRDCVCEYENFYPFGTSVGDQKGPQEDDGTLQKNLVISHHFFEKEESVIWVNENGVLSYFDKFFDNSPRPFVQLPEGPKILAAFWADHGIFAGNDSLILYREVKNQNISDTANKDVRAAFPNESNFITKRVFIATWVSVLSFNGAENLLNQGRRGKRQTKNKAAGKADCFDCEGMNTYQVVVIAGKKKTKKTFVIFNYDRIEWITGFPGEATQVGISSGLGEIFNLKLGNNTTWRDLPNYSNVNVPGRYMFKVSGEHIEPAGPVEEVA